MNTDNLTPHEQKQIVIHQLRMERLRLAFTANLYDYRVAISEHTRQASARRKEIDAIIEKLSAAPKFIQLELFAAPGEIRL
jgi:hypothetical protein